jgi:hypothetical protein
MKVTREEFFFLLESTYRKIDFTPGKGQWAGPAPRTCCPAFALMIYNHVHPFADDGTLRARKALCEPAGGKRGVFDEGFLRGWDGRPDREEELRGTFDEGDMEEYLEAYDWGNYCAFYLVPKG